MNSSPGNTTLIELHVPDFKLVKEYYKKLEFEVIRETEPEEKKGYLVLRMQKNILCFWAGNESVYEHSYFGKFPRDTQRGYAVEIVLMVDDVEAYYERVKNGAHVVKPLGMQAWGLKDFRVLDPFGYYLRFTSLHNVLNETEKISVDSA